MRTNTGSLWHPRGVSVEHDNVVLQSITVQVCSSSSSPAQAVRMARIHGMMGRRSELITNSIMVAKPKGVATESLNSRYAVLTARTIALSISGEARSACACKHAARILALPRASPR